MYQEMNENFGISFSIPIAFFLLKINWKKFSIYDL